MKIIASLTEPDSKEIFRAALLVRQVGRRGGETPSDASYQQARRGVDFVCTAMVGASNSEVLEASSPHRARFRSVW
jgi:hypothetical protein